MTTHRPIEFAFAAAADAAPLLRWLEDTRELAWVTHAPGHAEQNLELQSAAVAMLKGADTSRSLSAYNQALMQQRWQAFAEFSFSPPGDYLLWHMPSGPVDATNVSVRGPDRIAVDDPFNGWLDANSGSSSAWPTCATNPGFLHFQYATIEAPGPMAASSFIAQTHGRWTAAPAPLKRFWARLKQFAKKHHGVA